MPRFSLSGTFCTFVSILILWPWVHASFQWPSWTAHFPFQLYSSLIIDIASWVQHFHPPFSREHGRLNQHVPSNPQSAFLIPSLLARFNAHSPFVWPVFHPFWASHVGFSRFGATVTLQFQSFQIEDDLFLAPKENSSIGGTSKPRL